MFRRSFKSLEGREWYLDEPCAARAGSMRLHKVIDSPGQNDSIVKVFVGENSQEAMLSEAARLLVANGLQGTAPRLLDVGFYLENGRHLSPALRMERILGATLDALLRQERWRPGAIGAEAALTLGRRVLEPLGFLDERGLCHGDVSLGNIVVTDAYPAERSCKILDFSEMVPQGYANRSVRATDSTAAPERLAGPCGQTIRADVWSVGAILFYALTGSFPCMGGLAMETGAGGAGGWREELAEKRRGFRASLKGRRFADGDEDRVTVEGVLSRLLEPDPDDRPGAIEALGLVDRALDELRSRRSGVLERLTWAAIEEKSRVIAMAPTKEDACAAAKRELGVDIASETFREGYAKTWVQSLGEVDGKQLCCEMKATLLDVWHDDLAEPADGARKAGLTFAVTAMYPRDGELVRGAPLSRSMNRVNTNAGGWEGSDLRGFLNSEEFLASLGDRDGGDSPVSFFKKVLKATNNVGMLGGEALVSPSGVKDSVSKTADKLFVPSLVEVVGSKAVLGLVDADAVYQHEGEQYAFFEANGIVDPHESYGLLRLVRAFVAKGGGEDEASPWTLVPTRLWLRTPGAVSEWIYRVVGSVGNPADGANAAYERVGVVPCFCI